MNTILKLDKTEVDKFLSTCDSRLCFFGAGMTIDDVAYDFKRDFDYHNELLQEMTPTHIVLYIHIKPSSKLSDFNFDILSDVLSKLPNANNPEIIYGLDDEELADYNIFVEMIVGVRESDKLKVRTWLGQWIRSNKAFFHDSNDEEWFIAVRQQDESDLKFYFDDHLTAARCFDALLDEFWDIYLTGIYYTNIYVKCYHPRAAEKIKLRAEWVKQWRRTHRNCHKANDSDKYVTKYFLPQSGVETLGFRFQDDLEEYITAWQKAFPGQHILNKMERYSNHKPYCRD